MSSHIIRSLIILCLTMLLVLPVVTNAKTQQHKTKQQLVIFNWADYMSPELVKRFEAEFDAKVIQVFYESDDVRTERLVASKGRGYDLILVAACDLDMYVRRGWVAKIDEERLTNLKHISPRWRQGYVGSEHYAIPYSWGTTGILYRADLIKEPITSWKQFFKPSAELRGRIAMIGDSQDSIGMSLKSLGYSANSEDREQLKEAEKLLLAQKPFVASFKAVSIRENSAIIKGDIVAAMQYSSDALMLKEYHDQLTYVLPEEGGGFWIDCFVISKAARNPELAYAFLNYINEPENAAENARFLWFATPNQAAEKLLPSDFLNDPTIYPDKASLNKSEFSLPLSPSIQKMRNEIGIRVTR